MKLFNSITRTKPKGQSFIELALVFLSLPIIFVGVVELGFFLNVYLDVIDAGREAARNANTYDLYHIDEITGQKAISNLVFDEAAKIAWNTMNPGCQGLLKDKMVQLLPPASCDKRIPFDPANGYDDIVITVLSYDPATGLKRFPESPGPGWWSRFNNQNSTITNADIANLGLNPAALKTGMVMVEIFYNHYQLLGLPVISGYIFNPLHMHTYSIMPYPAADPTPLP